MLDSEFSIGDGSERDPPSLEASARQMRDWEASADPFSAWGGHEGRGVGGGRMAAVEAGPISRIVWDFIWLRVVSVERGGKKKIGYQELPGVTTGYQELPRLHFEF